MKAKLIIEQRCVNPDYDSAAHGAAKDRGETYDVPAYLPVAVGTVLEGPFCWGHCVPGHLNSPAVAEPADDECRKRVLKWMETERPAAIEQIRVMAQPKNLKKMKKETQEHVKAMAEAYKEELATGGDDGVSDESESATT